MSLVEITVSGSASSPTAALAEVVTAANAVVGQVSRNSGDIIVVGRRHTKLGDTKAQPVTVGSSSTSSATDMRRTVGVLADHLVASSAKASVLVVQAGKNGSE